MEETDHTTRRPFLRILFLLILFGLIGTALIASFTFYNWFLSPNVELKGLSSKVFLIPTGSGFNDVMARLSQDSILRNERSFRRVAGYKKYDARVRPGRYRIRQGMSNLELADLLRSGRQEPVRLIFNSLISVQDLAGKISRQIEADSASLANLLTDPDFLRSYEVKPATVFVLFIPNTYEFYWNTSARDFIRRMSQEQKKFWNRDRLEKSRATGLSVTEVVTLASIVERETSKNSEKQVIAGVYLNRLRKGWPLQADPTLIFAWNDYSIRRVLERHKQIQSPYNTYMHTGLPPGPICLPSISSIDAVLNYQPNDYLYFCARDDLSGYHVFSTTLAQHNRNAARYQAALKKLNIR
jgi:UPF0755 protein